jgi:hypothetical protein
VDLNLRRERHHVLGAILSLRWIPGLRSSVSLDGSVLRKRHGFLTTKIDLDSADAVRVIGDSHGGVVLQVHAEHLPRHFSLQLLRIDHLGMATVAPDALDALAVALRVIDLRDDLSASGWPSKVGHRHGDRARKPHRLTRASVQGRNDVANLLRDQADYERANGDLTDCPLAKVRFTSKSIAVAMMAAYEPLMMETPAEVTDVSHPA